jgi:hypothetical protein
MNNHEKTPNPTQSPRYTQPSDLPSARATQGNASHPIRRGFFMASLSLAAALTACWSATPQSVPGTVTNADTGFRVTNVQAFNSGVNSQGATGATGSSTGISINFDQAVDRASVERAISVFDGEVNNATNPATSTALGLTSMCNGNWRVRNPNATPISFTWDVYKTTQNGAGVVPANTDAFFTSSLGANTVRVFVNGKQQQTKATNPAACTSSALSFAWAADSKSVVASPKTALVLNKTYSVAVSTFAKNSSGSAALSVPFVSKVVLQENSSTSGTLVPGGSWTSKDGVRIVAPAGSISSPVTISVTKRSEPAESFGLLPSIYEPVAIYEVTSNPIAGTDSEDLQLYFPVPNAADLQQYALLRLSYHDAIPSLSGSGIKSWSNQAYNVERLNEIKQEQNTIDVDHFMIAKSTFPQVLLNSLEKNTTNGPNFKPKCKNVANCTTIVNQIESIQEEEYSKLIYDFGLDQNILVNKNIFRSSIIDPFDVRCITSKAAAIYEAIEKSFLFCVDPATRIPYALAQRNIVRHEFFHALQFEKLFQAGVRVENKSTYTYLRQFATNPGDRPEYTVGRRWFIEGTANAAEYSNRVSFSRSVTDLGNENVDNDLFKVTSTLKENRLKSGSTFQINDAYETQDFWVFAGQNTLNEKTKFNLTYLLDIFSSGLKSASPAQELDTKFSGIGYPGGIKRAYWEFSKNQSYERFESSVNLGNAPCSINLNTSFPDVSKKQAQEDGKSPIYVEDLSKALTYNFAGNSDQIKDKPFTVSSLTTKVITMNFSNAILTSISSA